jgi:hypothetical protein
VTGLLRIIALCKIYSNGLCILCLQVMYGGRVIDDFDRRIIRTYMDEYVGDFLFDKFQPYHFYCHRSVDYLIPEEGDRDSYLSKYLTFIVLQLSEHILRTMFLAIFHIVLYLCSYIANTNPLLQTMIYVCIVSCRHHVMQSENIFRRFSLNI